MENDGFQMTDSLVLATLIESRGNKVTRIQFKKNDCVLAEYYASPEDKQLQRIWRIGARTGSTGKNYVL